MPAPPPKLEWDFRIPEANDIKVIVSDCLQTKDREITIGDAVKHTYRKKDRKYFEGKEHIVYTHCLVTRDILATVGNESMFSAHFTYGGEEATDVYAFFWITGWKVQ